MIPLEASTRLGGQQDFILNSTIDVLNPKPRIQIASFHSYHFIVSTVNPEQILKSVLPGDIGC